MSVVAYTYEVDFHCIECTQARAARGGFRLAPESLHEDAQARLDEHGVSYDAVDREGNFVHPVFSTDEIRPDECCGDCHTLIEK